MKRSAYFFFFLLLIGYSYSVHAQVLPTKLRVTVIDDLGNFVEGAQVTLYTSEEDYRNNNNPVSSCTTDKKGRTLFIDLNPVSYYLEAHKGEQNNNGAGVQIEALAPKKLNKVNTVIQ